MRSVSLAALLVLLASACSSVPSAANLPQGSGVTHDGEVRFLLGGGALDKETWEPTDKPLVLGAEYVRQEPDSWLGYELGTRLGIDTANVSGTDLTLFTFELYGGYHHTFFADSAFQPYVGAGLGLVSATADATDGFVSVNDDDVSFGFYAHAGVAWDLDGWVLGLDGRYLGGTDVDLFGGSFDVDMTQVSLFLGFGI